MTTSFDCQNLKFRKIGNSRGVCGVFRIPDCDSPHLSKSKEMSHEYFVGIFKIGDAILVTFILLVQVWRPWEVFCVAGEPNLGLHVGGVCRTCEMMRLWI